jgi:hypothetical protein
MAYMPEAISQKMRQSQTCRECGRDLIYHSWGMACKASKKGYKMAKEWKQQQSGAYNAKFKFENKDDELVGVYEGSKEVKGGFSDKMQKVHTFKVDGVLTDVWGSGKLDYLLSEVAKGDEVKIVYLGMVSAKLNIKGRNVTKKIHDYVLYTR